MKPLFLLALLLWANLAALAAGGPANLRCEYLENPPGIDVRQPRLSWQISSDQRGVKQTAYRILVASSPELLAQGRGDRWDTGQVASDQSTQVAYAGQPLASRTRCYWQVKVWTQTSDPNPSVAATPWSLPAQWSMGLLQPADWSAQWISMTPGTWRPERGPGATTNAPNPGRDARNSPMLRKTFATPQPVKSAQVSICGLGYYELFLDGAKVGDHVLDPAWTSYHKQALYVTYDLATNLPMGRHALGVQLANGIYNQEFPDAWNFHQAPWRAFPQMRLQLDITYADGTRQRIVSDQSWKAAAGPVYWDQLRMGVMYDARREQPGWTTAAFDDSSWQPAILREGTGGALRAQMSEPIKVMATLPPRSIRPEGGAYVFDFGQNLSGWTRLQVAGPAGTQIILDHGHGSQFVQGRPLQTSVYTLKGGGEETWEPDFAFHGFSQVKVTGLPGQPNQDTVQARVVHTAFAGRGDFECSHPLLNKLVQMSRWSYVDNFVGNPSDCPHREKNGWTADAHLASELGLNYYGSEAAYTRWLLDFAAEQAPDGKLPCIIPDGGQGWGTRFLDGPAWESAYLIIPWNIYQYRGDRRLLEQHYEHYQRWLAWYRDATRVIDKKRFEGGGSKASKYKNPQRVNQGGIIYYGIGDWPPESGGMATPCELTATAYYYQSAWIIAQIAGLLGKTAEAQAYAGLAAQTRAAFNREFYDAATGTYAQGSQTGMACALYFGLVEERNRQKVAAILAESLRTNHYAIKIGCLGSKYLLRALAENGHLDTAWQVLTRTNSPGWGYLAASGRTTLTESLDGSGSDNHVFLGDVAAWMMQYLAGIRYDPAHPGFQRFRVQPECAGDLTWVKAHHDSPYGRIRSEWTRAGGHFTLHLTVPPNSVAEVTLPTGQPATVTESQAPAMQARGVKFLRQDGQRAIFEVGSGEYEFACEMGKVSRNGG